MTFALPDELERLSTVLRWEPATSLIADSLDTDRGRYRNQWATKRQLQGVDVPLPVPRNQSLHPIGCELHSAYLSFQFEIREGESLPWRAEYQVRVQGLLDADNAIFELEDHWRLDTDMYAPCRIKENGSQPNSSKEPHPLFHFQRGGQAQDAFASTSFLPGNPCAIPGQWRALMQSAGPRIPVLPLDPIMAIDFCLSQNDGTVWRRLRNIPEYLNIVKNAQERMWLPLFEKMQDGAFRRLWIGPSILV